MSYIELHACSAFSFLRGASFPEQLAETAAELAMPAMALLDRNGVYGAQRFSVTPREHNVRPIIGCELSMEDGTILPVLVANRTGYKNLCQLLTQAHLRSEKGKCAIQWNELPQFAEGLVALLGSACATQPEDRAQFFIHTLGRENVFVEIQRHFLRGEKRINQQLVDLAAHYRLPILATNGVQHARPRGREVLDVFTCIREHTHLDAAGKLLTRNSERHLKGDVDMRELFRDLREAIENTSRLAERLTFFKREPERLARYRSGSSQRRSERKCDSGNLSALRQTRRRNDGERDHLSWSKRRARNRQGIKFFPEHSGSLLASLRKRRFSTH